MYRPTQEQVQNVVDAGLFAELNAHNYNVENFDELTHSEQQDASEFARRLFEMDGLEDIWDFGVYC